MMQTDPWMCHILGTGIPNRRNTSSLEGGGSSLSSVTDGCQTGRYVVDLGVSPWDAVSWTARISHNGKSGQHREALRSYEEMLQGGLKPNSYTCIAALKACGSLQDLESCKRIHSHAVECGLEFNIFVGNMLVDVYAKCGSLKDARLVFEKMSHHTVVSWNAMILGYAHMQEGESALQLYARMQREGFIPNDRTCVGALKACSSLASSEQWNPVDGKLKKVRSLRYVRAIHSDVVKGRFESNVFVGNMLVDVYAKCGSLVDARNVFHKMPHRDVISWTAMIMGYAQMEEGDKALLLYAQMHQEAVVPNDRTFVAALKACSSLASLGEGTDRLCVNKQVLYQVRGIHSDIVRIGCESDVFVGTMLVDSYAKCGSILDARRVFEKMPHRTVVSWNAMILGYAQMQESAEALLLYTRMQREGVLPDDRTFVSALKACSSLAAFKQWTDGDRKCEEEECLEKVRGIHFDIVKRGHDVGLFVGNMLVDAYAKCGSLVDARHVFEKMNHHDVVSWNAMILGYAHMDEGVEALQLFGRMQQYGAVPNDRTYVAALKACSSWAASADRSQGHGTCTDKQCVEQVRAIHAEVVKSEYESDVYVATMLVDAYVKCGSLVEARRVFDKMPCRHEVSWNEMILGHKC